MSNPFVDDRSGPVWARPRGTWACNPNVNPSFRSACGRLWKNLPIHLFGKGLSSSGKDFLVLSFSLSNQTIFVSTAGWFSGFFEFFRQLPTLQKSFLVRFLDRMSTSPCPPRTFGTCSFFDSGLCIAQDKLLRIHGLKGINEIEAMRRVSAFRIA